MPQGRSRTSPSSSQPQPKPTVPGPGADTVVGTTGPLLSVCEAGVGGGSAAKATFAASRTPAHTSKAARLGLAKRMMVGKIVIAGSSSEFVRC